MPSEVQSPNHLSICLRVVGCGKCRIASRREGLTLKVPSLPTFIPAKMISTSSSPSSSDTANFEGFKKIPFCWQVDRKSSSSARKLSSVGAPPKKSSRSRTIGEPLLGCLSVGRKRWEKINSI